MTNTQKFMIGGVVGGMLIGGYTLMSDNNIVRNSDSKTTKTVLPNGETDRDCPDFTSQRAAQEFFEASGGPTKDPHNLDRDGDGKACESL